MPALNNLLEPKRAILAWQSSRPDGTRRRWAVGELTRPDVTAEAPVILRYFDDHELEGPRAEGFFGYPAFKLGAVHSNEVLDTLMLRLPPRRRRDFADYLATYFIAPDAKFTDFALLSATEAKLPSDGFSVVDPLDEVGPRSSFMIEVAGNRHQPVRPALMIDDVVAFRPEPANAHDPWAIEIMVNNQRVGYVNRLQTAAFHGWINRACVTGRIAKINGSVEKPRVLIFVRVE